MAASVLAAPGPGAPVAQALNLNAATAAELRTAIDSVNAASGTGPHIITLTTEGPYLLTCGTGEDANANGDLDVVLVDDALTITHPGPGRATIAVEASCEAERVLDIHGDPSGDETVRLERVVITGGDLGATRGGTSEGSGGGLRSIFADLELVDVVVEANHASDGIPDGTGLDARGGSGGGVFFSGGVLTIDDSVIRDNRAGDGSDEGAGDYGFGGEGGGLATIDAEVTLTDTVVTANRAGDGGAGVVSPGAGRGGRGGGIYATGDGSLSIVGGAIGGDAEVDGNRAGDGNTAANATSGRGGDGGGIRSNNGVVVTLVGTQLGHNLAGTGGANTATAFGGAGGNGGGISAAGNVEVSATRIHDNRAGTGGLSSASTGGNGGRGGGIEASGSTTSLVLVAAEIADNVAGTGGVSDLATGGGGGAGGGIRYAGPELSITMSEITGNRAGNGGAGTADRGGAGGGAGGFEAVGFAAVDPSVTVIDSVVSANAAGVGGVGGNIDGVPGAAGGGQISASPSAVVTGSLVAGNSTSNAAGGLRLLDSSTSIVNSTFDANVAERGGALWVSSGSLSVASTTLSSNTAPIASSLNNLASSVTISRSAIADALGGGAHCVGGGVTDGGDNVEHDPAGSGSCGVDTVVTSLDLDPLADNGGPTPTRLPSLGGPLVDAIDGGDCVETVDQRGVARPQEDGCDIGAVELELFINVVADAASGFGDELVVDVLANDVGRDLPLDPASVVVSNGPSNGTTDVDPATGEVTYTPTGLFEGTDQFFYSVCLLGAGSGTPDQTCGQAVVNVDIDRPDRTPNAFSFADVTDVEPSTVQTSAAVTIAGIAAPSPVSVVGGTYSVNGGPFTASAGTVDAGDAVRVRHTSAAEFSTATDTTLTVGGVSDTFTSTTAATPVPDGASRFVSLSPERLFDTRFGTGGVPIGKVPVDGTLDVQVGGRLGVPVDAAAVVVNITVDQPDGPAFVTAYPRGGDRPLASTLNITAPGQIRPNLAVVPLDDDGFMSIYAQNSMHLLGDVAGYFESVDVPVADGRVVPLEPTRIFDSRPGEPANGPKGFVAADQSVTVQIAGEAGVPDTGVSAVVLNVTATEAAGDGFVTVWPTGSDRPLASSLNLQAGGTAANLVIVPLGDGGRIDMYTLAGAHLLADVTGYVTDDTVGAATAGLFVPVEPGRVFDTRPAEPGNGPKGFVPAGGEISTSTAGVADIPADAAAVVLNVTATEAPTGFVTAWPTGADFPLASTLNLQGPGDTRANAAILPLGAGGAIDYFSQNGAHLLADTTGYFLD